MEEWKDGLIEVEYDENGLIPAVLQDVDTGEILMVAWMNAEALERTRKTGQTHFWSRSREELWHKGATSGNVMPVQEILVDCDADTLLVKVKPAGPACHTDERSCFYRSMGKMLEDWKDGSVEGWQKAIGHSAMLTKLFSIIEKRKAHPRVGSYTNQLMGTGEDAILQKVGEEAMEVVLAAKGQGNERLIEEIADLFYHSLVLLSFRGLSLAQVEDELARRHGER